MLNAVQGIGDQFTGTVKAIQDTKGGFGFVGAMIQLQEQDSGAGRVPGKSFHLRKVKGGNNIHRFHPLLLKMDISSETGRIQQFVTDGNYHAAINIALSCLNECRRNDNQAGADECLGIIKAITETLAVEFGSDKYPDKT